MSDPEVRNEFCTINDTFRLPVLTDRRQFNEAAKNCARTGLVDWVAKGQLLGEDESRTGISEYARERIRAFYGPRMFAAKDGNASIIGSNMVLELASEPVGLSVQSVSLNREDALRAQVRAYGERSIPRIKPVRGNGSFTQSIDVAGWKSETRARVVGGSSTLSIKNRNQSDDSGEPLDVQNTTGKLPMAAPPHDATEPVREFVLDRLTATFNNRSIVQKAVDRGQTPATNGRALGSIQTTEGLGSALAFESALNLVKPPALASGETIGWCSNLDVPDESAIYRIEGMLRDLASVTTRYSVDDGVGEKHIRAPMPRTRMDT